jgi:hypothetical protein
VLFTTDDITQLLENVDYFHTVFIAGNIGVEVLQKADRRLLTKYGVNLDKFNGQLDYVTYAYNFGKLESTVKDRNTLRKLTLPNYKRFAETITSDIKLSKQDKYSIATIKQEAYNDIKKLANDIKTDFANVFVQTSKTQRLYLERMLKQKASGKEISQYLFDRMRNELTGKAKTYTRRFEMISGYIMHSAYQHGVSNSLLSSKGENVRVFYSVHSDACVHCKRVYLRPDGTPKIFYLKNIIAYGSNRGKKAKYYTPSVDPLHPHCRCKMCQLPQGKIRWDVKAREYVRVF